MRGGSVFSQDKLFLHGDRVREYLVSGRTSAPVTLELDLTNKCNNLCPGCTGYKGDGVSMSQDLAERVIGEAADLGVRGLIFTGGGEPFLHKGIGDLVGLAGGKGLSVGVISSGQFPKSVSDDVLDGIVGVSKWVRVSLDAGGSDRYLLTHGLKEKFFDRAVESVGRLVESKKRVGSSCTIGVGYLTGLGDVGVEQVDVDAFARLVSGLGADYAQLRPFHGSSRVVDYSPVVKDELSGCGTELLSSAHKYKFMGDGKRSYDYCHGARFASVVTADGSLTVCCHYRNQGVGRVVNLNDVSLKDAWESELLEDKVGKIDVSKCLPFCRADNFNRSLENLSVGYENEHKDFL